MEETSRDNKVPLDRESDARPAHVKRFGFPKEARIKTKSTFDAVFSEGGKGVTRALVMYVRPNPYNRNRLGLVVGKKVGNAVRRNRVRRLIKEAFRLETPSLEQGYDLVCIPRPHGFPAKTQELIPLFRASFERGVHNFRRGVKSGKRRS